MQQPVEMHIVTGNQTEKKYYTSYIDNDLTARKIEPFDINQLS